MAEEKPKKKYRSKELDELETCYLEMDCENFKKRRPNNINLVSDEDIKRIIKESYINNAMESAFTQAKTIPELYVQLAIYYEEYGTFMDTNINKIKIKLIGDEMLYIEKKSADDYYGRILICQLEDQKDGILRWTQLYETNFDMIKGFMNLCKIEKVKFDDQLLEKFIKEISANTSCYSEIVREKFPQSRLDILNKLNFQMISKEDGGKFISKLLVINDALELLEREMIKDFETEKIEFFEKVLSPKRKIEDGS